MFFCFLFLSFTLLYFFITIHIIITVSHTKKTAIIPKKQKVLTEAGLLSCITVENLSRYRVKSIPAAGAILKPEDRGEQQMSMLD